MITEIRVCNLKKMKTRKRAGEDRCFMVLAGECHGGKARPNNSCNIPAEYLNEE
jgi:hypothetical protein